MPTTSRMLKLRLSSKRAGSRNLVYLFATHETSTAFEL
jgi:hypothetical protein